VVPPFFFFQNFVVEARIIIIHKLLYIFTIWMIPASTTKFWKKKKGLPLFLLKLNNIINILKLKLDFDGRIGDADEILDVQTDYWRLANRRD